MSLVIERYENEMIGEVEVREDNNDGMDNVIGSSWVEEWEMNDDVRGRMMMKKLIELRKRFDEGEDFYVLCKEWYKM